MYYNKTMNCRTLNNNVFPGGSFSKKKKKSMPAMQETWAQHLDKENPLEKEMATQSSILAWKIPWTEKPGGLHSMGLQRV